MLCVANSIPLGGVCDRGASLEYFPCDFVPIAGLRGERATDVVVFLCRLRPPVYPIRGSSNG